MSQPKKGALALHAKASQVFADFFDIFADKYCIRRIKHIKAILAMEHHRRYFEMACIRLAMSPEDLVSLLQDLIIRGVFDPDLKVAKECFPDLFIVARPEPETITAPLKQKKTQNQVDKVFGEVQQNELRQNFNPSSGQNSMVDGSTPMKGKATTEWALPASASSPLSSTGKETKKLMGRPQHGPASSQETTVKFESEISIEQVVGAKVPNLLPVHLPTRIQQALLAEAQIILERGCYYFVTKWTPNGTLSPPFNSPKSAGLHEWIVKITREWDTYPAEAIDEAALSMESSLTHTIAILEKLGHSVVHGVNSESEYLELMIDAGARFMEILKDGVRSLQMKKIAQTITGLSEPLENQTILLMGEWKKELTEIEQNRRDLKEQEINVVKKFWEEHKRMKESVCFNMKGLRQSLEAIKDGAEIT
ncbi:hypothetical protein TWF694_008258 [Orbilia ellipsospora]|uniref:Uncharacterized protein n=1 Tax=Orbilia ellipsospora TaxID=2528407 RepID=A0AAV9XFI9_9PEZI